MEAQSVVLDLSNQFSAGYVARIGNVDKLVDQYGRPYRFIRRSAVPIGVVNHPQMAVKLYHMTRETEPLPANLVSNVEDFVIGEISSGNVDLKQGLGFAILSQGFLSINVWGRGNVLFTQTYTVEKAPPNLSAEPLAKTGVACTWEQRIMSFEYERWHEFLESKMQDGDKLRYLSTFLAGKLY